MKRFFYLSILMMLAISAMAQGSITNMAWSKKVYREIDLTKAANSSLFSPVVISQQKTLDTEGLFNTLFDLVMNNKINAYKYNLSGNASFDEEHIVDMQQILKDFSIPYKKENGKVMVDFRDIPSEEVLTYYVREQITYNPVNSSFRRKVDALCPVIVGVDEVTGETTKYPMFWVTYYDIQPYLTWQKISSHENESSVMTMNDYFLLNCYEGQIYRTENPVNSNITNNTPEEQNRDGHNKTDENIAKVIEKTYNTYYK